MADIYLSSVDGSDSDDGSTWALAKATLAAALTAAGADVTYCNIQSSWGHDAFLLEVDTLTGLISNFLERLS